MSYPVFSGSIVALITPLTEQGEVDYTSLKHLVDYHVASGTDAIVVCGTTGEAATLSEAETLEVIAHVVKYADKRIKVIAGSGSNSTQKCIDYTKKLEKLGIDACLTVVPYYNKPNQEGLYQHFKAIAASTVLPQILYNVPGRTVVSLDVDTIVRLAEIPNIIGIKDAHPDLHRVGQIVARTKDLEFFHLSGDDPQALEAIRLGSNGVVSVTANVIAKEWADLVHLALDGKYFEAFEANLKYDNFHRVLFVEPNPSPVKYICKRLGLIASAKQRLPLVPVSESTAQLLDGYLKDFGLIK